MQVDVKDGLTRVPVRVEHGAITAGGNAAFLRDCGLIFEESAAAIFEAPLALDEATGE